MYDDLTNEELLARIKEYRDAIGKAALGGGVQRIQGEGRSVTKFGADANLTNNLLRMMIAEAIGRGIMGAPGGAIAVEIG